MSQSKLLCRSPQPTPSKIRNLFFSSCAFHWHHPLRLPMRESWSYSSFSGSLNIFFPQPAPSPHLCCFWLGLSFHHFWLKLLQLLLTQFSSSILSIMNTVLFWHNNLDDRGWDGWMAPLTQWTWIWVNSGSLWWTGRHGTKSQTRLSDWTELKSCYQLLNVSY